MDSIFFHEPGESKHFRTFQFAAGISWAKTFHPVFAGLWIGSSMVEQLTLNQLVEGSSPSRSTSLNADSRGDWPHWDYFHSRNYLVIPRVIPLFELPPPQGASLLPPAIFPPQAVRSVHPLGGGTLLILKATPQTPRRLVPPGGGTAGIGFVQYRPSEKILLETQRHGTTAPGKQDL